MCEIPFLLYLGFLIGRLADKKGYGPLFFRGLFLVWWLGIEVLALFAAAARYSIEEFGVLRPWVVAFLAALFTSPAPFLLLLFLPNRGPNERSGAFGDHRDWLDQLRRDRRRGSARRKRRGEEPRRRRDADE